jgi:serine protease Do
MAALGAVAAVLLLAPVALAQPPATPVAKEVNKKLVKLFGAGGFKGLPSYGTGIAVSPNGFILTVNNHILTTTDLRVHLFDGRFYHAKVVAKEPELDVALIKLEEPVEKLPCYNIETEAAKPTAVPGTWVLAFSNQFAIAERDEPMSVQHGVVQAFSDLKGRKGVADAPFQGKVYFIDVVACNPGAAGGALTNYKGDLLGILGRELKNKLSDSWINYAVPVTAAVELINDETKKVEKVAIKDFVSLAMAGKWKPHTKKVIAKGPGVYHGIILVPNPVSLTPPYIEAVVPGSPADKAGLRTDDLIVYVDGELVQSIKGFKDLINSYQPGQQVRLDVQRGAQLETVTLTLEKNPPSK